MYNPFYLSFLFKLLSSSVFSYQTLNSLAMILMFDDDLIFDDSEINDDYFYA